MIFGIYARKSVYSDDSDSIENQINMCIDYIKKHYNIVTDIIKYYDEGYTGANTQRPGFNLLLKDVKNKKINTLVCYKIDRISRNVVDFSKTFEELQKNNIQFISIKEQIDTSTPLGRAMMYICSVFAQMERETIAERIKDSSLALAKSGKWPGGRPPLGYMREKIIIDGKKHTTLVKNPDEVDLLNYIVEEFLDGNTLSGLETKFRHNKIKSRLGSYFSSTQIYQILSCPQYVAATPKIYDYFQSKGCNIVAPREKFDGKHGILVYNRTSGSRSKKHVINPPNMWYVTVGLHEPLLSAEKWLAIQERFGKNKIDKTRKHEIGILKGILKCKCGYTMRTKYKHDKQYNIEYTHYFCPQRTRKGKQACDTPMIPIDLIDNKVIDIMKNLSINKDHIELYMKKELSEIRLIRSKEIINNEMNDCRKRIFNLTKALQENYQSQAAKYIIADIEKLDKQLISLEYELRELEESEKERAKRVETIDTIYEKILEYIKDYELLPYKEKNRHLAAIIKECIWNDGELTIVL